MKYIALSVYHCDRGANTADQNQRVSDQSRHCCILQYFYSNFWIIKAMGGSVIRAIRHFPAALVRCNYSRDDVAPMFSYRLSTADFNPSKLVHAVLTLRSADSVLL